MVSSYEILSVVFERCDFLFFCFTWSTVLSRRQKALIRSANYRTQSFINVIHFFLFKLHAHDMLNAYIYYQFTSYTFRCLLHHLRGDHYVFFLWRWSPTRTMASSFLVRFLDHTQRRATVGRTPLDEWSARRRDLYLTTHNTHKDKHPCLRRDSNPQTQQASWPQTYALDRATIGTGRPLRYLLKNYIFEILL